MEKEKLLRELHISTSEYEKVIFRIFSACPHAQTPC
jgi:hypothetical protein